MKIVKKISKTLKKIRKIVAKSEYEGLELLFSQEKYADLFQKVIQLDGEQVQVAVDDLMKDVVAFTKEQFKKLFKEKDVKDQSLLDGFQKILRDQLIQIYWISVIFNQFNSFVFVGFHSLTLQQYCLKQILDSSFGKYTKKIVNEIIEALIIRKKSIDDKEKFNKDLLQIINFFSFRTFLTLLSIEKQSEDYKMNVIFNCEFTEEVAKKLIQQLEKEKKEEEMFQLSSSSDEEGEKDKEIMQEEGKSDNESSNSNMEIEEEEDKKKKQNLKKAKNQQRYESLYSLIEEMYIERLVKDSEEFIASIKDIKVSKQIKQIEEYIFQEEKFISYYMNRLSIKVADKLNSVCVINNYPNLVNHPNYGLNYLLKKKDINKLKDIYTFVQNDSESIKILSQRFNQVIEHRIQEVEKEQEKLFQSYREKQQEEQKNSMDSKEDKETLRQKDIMFIQTCQEKWIESIFQIYKDMHTDALTQAFESNSSLNAALSRAFESQFNVSEVIVDYLVNTCNTHLLSDKFRGIEHEQIEDQPEKVLFKLFSFSSQKDQFLEIYRRQLSNRLIYKMSSDESKESKFLGYLEEVIGSTTSINNMRSMIQDLSKNALLQTDYLDHLHSEKKVEKKLIQNSNKENKLNKEPSKGGHSLTPKKNSRRDRSRSRSRSRSDSNERRLTRRQRNRRKIRDSQNDLNDESHDSENDERRNSQEENKNHDDIQIIEDDGFIEIHDDDNEFSDDIMIIEQDNKAQKKDKDVEKQNKDNKSIVINLDESVIEVDKSTNKADNEIIESHGDDDNVPPEAINITILTYIKWPLKQTKTSSETILPKSLELHYKDYTGKYLKEFEHQRKVDLLHHCSYSTMVFRSDAKSHHKGVYTLQVSSYTMIILLCFNQQTKLKFNEIVTQTGIKKKTLQEKLNILTKFNLIISDGDKDMEIEDGDNNKKNKLYRVNTQFYNKYQELNIDQIHYEPYYSAKILEALRNDQEPVKDQKEVTKEVNHHRKIVMNSVIVKIMKEKEKLSQDELLQQVQAKLKISNIFTPTNASVKEQITDCINQSYIKFSDKEEEKNILIYIK